MIKVMRKTGLVALFLYSGFALAQNISVEGMAGDKNYWYQHIVISKFSPDSRFGFFNVSSLYAFYDKDRPTEIMSQSYITFSLRKWITASAGTFYATGPGFTPSFAVQFIKHGGNFFLLVVPRMDLKKDATGDIMTLAEFRPPLSEKVRLYSRIQAMSNFSKDGHNRSYQNLRVGIGFRKAQFGLALSIDEYGEEADTFYNTGIFLRTGI